MLSFWSSKSEIQASFTRQAHVLPAYDVQLALHFHLVWPFWWDCKRILGGMLKQQKLSCFLFSDCFPTVSLFVCVPFVFCIAFSSSFWRQNFEAAVPQLFEGRDAWNVSGYVRIVEFSAVLCFGDFSAVRCIPHRSDAFSIIQMHSASFSDVIIFLTDVHNVTLEC